MTHLRPGCKINLALRVLERRPDGYHALDSIFLPLPYPCDDLWLELTARPGCRIDCDIRELCGKDNLLHKAYELFRARTGIKQGVQCRLRKRIPQGAGLGGGSSDAAALLLWLNRMRNSPLSWGELVELARQTGADVPFFLLNVPARSRGVGEILEPLAESPVRGVLLLADPAIRIRTGWAFNALDEMRQAREQSVKSGLTKTCSLATGTFPLSGRYADFASRAGNDLEEPVFAAYPVLAGLKRRILLSGATAAGMSGSGSCIFGVYSSPDLAMSAAAALRSDGLRVFTVPITA